ncbi:GIY-YIG nuclease family protein [Spirochaeta lutea]|uniref:GIY-YIG domain-containing protein n=1 Tax=Spirochaeta lutea TaxID=1480694 RepID=A0A098R3P8_9SPIO|nr:GIY-YIG nuclease family protein [Spirochaeta lutea]KGE73312.1 hypothetical protein DC28_04600 [Spirochaeta lutea]
MTGIYRITNIINKKKYIGQSINIFQRWKQHTSALTDYSNETIIRSAFAKYGLREQVSKPGTYGNFIFEVIEECNPDILLNREYYFIKNENPEYNLMLMPPNELLSFDVTRKRNQGSHFIQYHNYDTEKHYPGIDENTEQYAISDIAHYISSRKKLSAYIDGAIIYLILGISINRKKQYFLWSQTTVDDMEFMEDEFLSYNVIGYQEFFMPILLNNFPKFRDFQKKLGNFAYGLSSISSSPFLETLKIIAKENKVAPNLKAHEMVLLYENEYKNSDS